MPDTGLEGAQRVAEILRQAVAARVTQPEPITISIGIATTSDSDATLDRTLTRADQALYLAKAAGRNCARVADTGDAVIPAAPPFGQADVESDRPASQVAGF